MKTSPTEPDDGQGEDGCRELNLLQERLGDALSRVLNQFQDPLVIALDGKRGTGKTHFLTRWARKHDCRNGGSAATVYFDAFAHDILGDPLPALASALEERISAPDAKVPSTDIQAMKEAAFRLAKPLTHATLALSGGETLLRAFEELAKGGDDEAKDPVEGFWKAEQGRRLAMERFRKAIKSLAEKADSSGTGSTVVIVVDELDRCRPDYALEVLEVIKHFFNVPRVHFVLGVNLNALEEMVRARYGSEIEAGPYLRKFIQFPCKLL